MLSSAFEMARRTRAVERQVHPKGERITVDDEWRNDVRTELEKKGWTQEDLAKQIPCSPATVTNLLKSESEGGSKQSRYVRRIHQLLGWKDTHDDSLRFVTRRWPALSDADRDTVRRLVDSLTTKR